MTGWLYSQEFNKIHVGRPGKITEDVARGPGEYENSAEAAAFGNNLGGSPVVKENYIRIRINSVHPNAGSNAPHIRMYFGKFKLLYLLGPFPKGAIITWDLNSIQSFLETIPADLWDEITLVNPFGDGIKISTAEIVHSSVTILNWNCNTWLDGSKLEKHTKMNLVAKILETKLAAVDNNWIAQIHWAARELGKTDGSKYDSLNAWCSEFASWVLRKACWNMPTGNIGSDEMENYFDALDRMYTIQQILDGVYVLNPGDYIRFQWSTGGQHSAIFIEYIDPYWNPSEDTRIRTIEGNTGHRVAVREWKLKDVISVGNTR